MGDRNGLRSLRGRRLARPVELLPLLLLAVFSGCAPGPAAHPVPDATQAKKPTLISFADAMQTLKTEDELYESLRMKCVISRTRHDLEMREYEEAVRNSDDDKSRELNREKQWAAQEAFNAQMEPLNQALTQQEERYLAARKVAEEAHAREHPATDEEIETAELPLDVESFIAGGLVERMPGDKFRLLVGSRYDLPLHARMHIHSVEQTRDENGKLLSTYVEFESRDAGVFPR